MIPIPKTGPAPKIDSISIREWNEGTVTAREASRTPLKGLRASLNLMLDQDSTLTPRPSLLEYGQALVGTVLGDMFEFVRMESGLPVNYLITVQNVAGTAKVYIQKDGGTWQECNGKTYDTSARCHFFQADDKVGVLNGEDNLSYLDLTSLAVVPFVALTTPTTPSATRNAGGSASFIGSTTYTYYYKVTANSTVGETSASPVASVGVGTQRDVWTGNDYVTITWASVASAQSYNVYMGTVSGQEVLIARGINGLSFRDDGSMVADITTAAPIGDTTAGPKVTRGYVINDVIFLTGDKDNKRYVRNGGIGTSMWDFSPFGGGGWTEIGRGGKEFPVVVRPFRTGQGMPAVTVLSKGTNGTGKRHIMDPQTITSGDIIINYYDVLEDNGQDGTDSPDGVILYKDKLWYPSKDGFKTTGTKPQLQNLLSTDFITETIQDAISTLNSATMDKCVGLAYQQRLYWALPVGSTTNNQIWVLDLQRKGAWMKPWNIAADAMTLYNDNNGETHFLMLSGNVVYKLTDSQATMDGNVPFRTNATSGFIKFSENGLEWAKVIDVTFVLLRPQGTIEFTVSGRTEDAQLETVGQEAFTPSSSVAGWGEDGWGDFGWSNLSEVPSTYADQARFVTVEVDEELQWVTWEMNTSGAGVKFQLADVIIRYVNIGVKDLT